MIESERSEPPLHIYADTSDIVPFWARLPKFFVYPLHFGAMVMIVVSMGLAYVAQFLPFTFWVLALISIGFVRYGFAVLEHTARGHLTPDKLFGEDGDAAMRPYKLWIILVLIAFLTIATMGAVGWGTAMLLYLVLMVVLPASIMSLGVSDSLIEAINPRTLVFIIGQVGAAYFLLDFFLLMLSGSSAGAFYLVRNVVPRGLFLPVYFGLELYFGLVMFAMIGYVAYQYHDRLGLDVKHGQAEREPDDGERIARMVEDNRIDDAIAFAYEVQRTHPDDVDAADRYYKVLVLAKQAERVLTHAQRFIPLLTAKARNARALEVYAVCRRIEKEFRLQRAADQLALAAAASTRPDDPTVIELLQQFDERYPGSREIAGAWLLHAKTLTDRLRQDQAASALFFRVIETYPAWPEAREARQYLAVLKQMAPPREGTPGAGDLSP